MTLRASEYAHDGFELAGDGVLNERRNGERALRRTILLVEDDPFVRAATCSILKHAGFDVLPAEDASAAMKVYEECARTIDLVMTDMVLPGRNGQELGRDLRERSAEVVVLVTSGYFNPEYEIEEAESRTYFLAKPYSRRTLLEKIEKILGTTALAHRATQAG
jgi:two-component system cell cycle sensor histidine kinase/response regulator CckA